MRALLAALLIAAVGSAPTFAKSCNEVSLRPDLGFAIEPQFAGEGRRLRITTGLPMSSLQLKGLKIAPPAADAPAMIILLGFEYDPATDTIRDQDLGFQFMNKVTHDDGTPISTSNIETKLVFMSPISRVEGFFANVGYHVALFQGDKYPVGANHNIIEGKPIYVQACDRTKEGACISAYSQLVARPEVVEAARALSAERHRMKEAGTCE